MSDCIFASMTLRVIEAVLFFSGFAAAREFNEGAEFALIAEEQDAANEQLHLIQQRDRVCIDSAPLNFVMLRWGGPTKLGFVRDKTIRSQPAWMRG